MDIMEELTLAILLASRLCHDLISPVGAIHNGLEIVEDETDREMLEHAQSLIKQSAHSASARLQFYRIAFGAGGSLGERIQISQIQKISQSLAEIYKIDVNWYCADLQLPKEHVQFLLNLLLIAAEGLPRGGLISVQVEVQGATTMRVEAEGPKVFCSQKAIDILNRGSDVNSLEPKQSNLYLTHCLAKQLRTHIQSEVSDSSLVLSATVKELETL